MEAWKRTLVVTAVAQTFSIIGFSFVTPFLPLFIQTLGVHGVAHVTLWAGILSGGTALCMAVSAPVWGILADRHGRKIMVVRASFSAAFLIGIMGLVGSVYQLLALRMLQGAFTGTVTASQALVATQSPKDRMGFSLGVMQTSVFLGNSIGPLVGGVVVDQVGFRPTFVVGGAILLIGAVLVTFFVHEDRPEPVVQTGSEKAGFFAGMGKTLQTPMLLPMIGVIFGVQFAVTSVFPILPQFVQMLEGGGRAATMTGIIFTGAGIAGAASSLIAGSFADRHGYRAVIVSALSVAALLSLPQIAVQNPWQLLLLRIAIGLAMGAVMPSASALIARLVSPEERGTAYGLMGSATSIGFGAGPLAAAGIVAVFGIRSVFLMAAVVLGLIALWVALKLPATISESLSRRAARDAEVAAPERLAAGR